VNAGLSAVEESGDTRIISTEPFVQAAITRFSSANRGRDRPAVQFVRYPILERSCIRTVREPLRDIFGEPPAAVLNSKLFLVDFLPARAQTRAALSPRWNRVSMPIRLIPTSSGQPIKLDKPVLLIGRNPDCDVVLTESRKVSRNHCLIACVDDKLFIRDLGSTNGVWINGHRVEREGRIRSGDELSIADLKYAVRQVDRNGIAKPDRPGRPASQQPVSDENEASGRRVRKVGIEARPEGDQPVAIPDEDDSFVVEASAPRLPRVRPDDVEAEHGEAPRKPPRRKAPAPPADSGVLELAEPLNLDMPLDLGAALDNESNEADVPDQRAVADQLASDDGATPQGDLSDAWLPAGDDDDLPIIPLDD